MPRTASILSDTSTAPRQGQSSANLELITGLVVAGVLAGIWYLLDGPFFAQFDKVNYWMNHHVAVGGALVLSMIGLDAEVVKGAPYPELVRIYRMAAVNVGTQCNGIPMLYLFAAFVMAHPGPWLRKLWFIPFGLLIIHLSNLVRVAALGYLSLYHPEVFVFNHKYAYAAVVYGIIISLFAWWHLRLSRTDLRPAARPVLVEHLPL